MTRPNTGKRKNRALLDLQTKGFAALAIGAGLLLLPVLAGSTPAIRSLAGMLQPLGGIVLLLGAVLLALHLVLKPKAAGAAVRPRRPRSHP